ncbi:unnamed protein product [Lepeophtheirus salmonis]|uniref:(salmon louse) hypothetical protein n=1 Tax=Lepeophtheirus salmonis TaxID=72036 RepID=A0A7R8CR51_LEPSM|nr:unnamed protein product [Lepeophtheirus salmonis]CAF2901650.1 unnamed protein product [Lepeophtheirus salmonis]
MKIACPTTLREDQLGGAPVLSRPHMNKKARGSMEEAYTGCVLSVKWKDNKVVSVASNKMRAQSLQKVKRRRNNPNLSLLNFTRNLVIAVLKTYGVAKKRPGPKYPLGSAAKSV